MPQLQKLDNVVVQPDEVANAMRIGIELLHPLDVDESIPYTNYGPPQPQAPVGPPSYQVSWFQLLILAGNLNFVFIGGCVTWFLEVPHLNFCVSPCCNFWYLVLRMTSYLLSTHHKISMKKSSLKNVKIILGGLSYHAHKL